MNTIRIYGASDDLVEFEGTFGEAMDKDEDGNNIDVSGPGYKGAEFNVYDSPAVFIVGELIIVEAMYDGTWSFTIRMKNEGTFPDWPIRFGVCGERDYSLEVQIDVPDEALAMVRRIG